MLFFSFCLYLANGQLYRLSTGTDLLDHNKGNLYSAYYDFLRHQWHVADDVMLSKISQVLSLCEKKCAFIITSKVERTLKRYGIRGYRYCLVDAGEVLAALMNILPFPLTVSDTPLDKLQMHFTQEMVMLSCECHWMSDASIIAPVNRAYSTPSTMPDVKPHPYLADNLNFVKDFHQQALIGRQAKIPLIPFLIDEDITERQQLVYSRYSASGFLYKPISRLQFDALLQYQKLWQPMICPEQVQLQFTWIIFNVDQFESGIYPFDSQRKSVLLKDKIPCDVLREQFMQHCQNQAITGECSCAVVISTPNFQPSTDSSAYWRHLLNVGLVDAHCYYQARRLQLASTCIGGFSDQGIKAFAGTNAQPLMIHLFGHDSQQEIKADAEVTPNKKGIESHE